VSGEEKEKKKHNLISALMERKALVCVCWLCVPVLTAERMPRAMETLAGD